MKTYSDLQDISHTLQFDLELLPVGRPEVEIFVDKHLHSNFKLFKPVSVQTELNLMSAFFVQVELKNKIKTHADQETAVIINLKIDGQEIIPRFNHLINYQDDTNQKLTTNYLGFNGKWRLTFDRPFYQWLHQATGQGWLLG